MTEEELIYRLQQRKKKDEEKNKGFFDRLTDMYSGVTDIAGGLSGAYNVLDNVTQYGMHNIVG